MSINFAMTNIANAIREKTGKTASLGLSDMAVEINNLSIPNKLLGYSYNGFILPALPTWDTTTYPYLTIFTEFKPTYWEILNEYSGNIYDSHSFIIYATSQPFTMRPYSADIDAFPNQYDLPHIELNNETGISCLQTRTDVIYEENFPIMQENIITDEYLIELKPIWANYDLEHWGVNLDNIWYNDGIYLTTTTPIPAYSIKK